MFARWISLLLNLWKISTLFVLPFAGCYLCSLSRHLTCLPLLLFRLQMRIFRRNALNNTCLCLDCPCSFAWVCSFHLINVCLFPSLPLSILIIVGVFRLIISKHFKFNLICDQMCLFGVRSSSITSACPTTSIITIDADDYEHQSCRFGW